MGVEGWNSLFQWGSVLLIAVTFFFGAGALWTGNRINERQTERLVSLERDLAVAKTAMSEQQERAANAEREVLILKERMAPRKLSVEQRSTLAAALKPPSPGASIEIGSPYGDAEAMAYAHEFRSVFISAGWQIVNGLSLGPYSGFGIGLSTTPDGPKDSAETKVVRQAFAAAGMELLPFVDPNFIGTNVRIVVGQKR